MANICRDPEVGILFSVIQATRRGSVKMKEYPRLLKLLRYWEGLPKDGRFPHRHNLLPETLPRDLFPHLVLVKIMQDVRDFEVTLIGRSVREAFPDNPVGKALSTYHTKENFDHFWECVDLMQITGLPIYSESMKFGLENTFQRARRLICPFSGDGGSSATHCLAINEVTVQEPAPLLPPRAVTSEILS